LDRHESMLIVGLSSLNTKASNKQLAPFVWKAYLRHKLTNHFP